MLLLVLDPLLISMLDVEMLRALCSGQRCLENDIDFGCKNLNGVGFFNTAMQYCSTADSHGSLWRLNVRSTKVPFRWY